MRIQAKYNGFTLLEISIVLIIIGLVTGGVLTGKDLIRAAQIRLQVSQIEKLDIAVNVFKSKYGCLPGDCANASDYGWGSTADNGNGNGHVDNYNYMDDPESVNFWFHLSQAQLINNRYNIYTGASSSTYIPGIYSPPLSMPGNGIAYKVGGGAADAYTPGGIWVIYKDRYLDVLGKGFSHAWFLTVTTDYSTWTGAYTGVNMYALDSKMDNGLPSSGSVQASNGYYQTGLRQMFTTAGSADACITNASPPTYNTAVVDPGYYSLCSPIVKAAF